MKICVIHVNNRYMYPHVQYESPLNGSVVFFVTDPLISTGSRFYPVVSVKPGSHQRQNDI